MANRSTPYLRWSIDGYQEHPADPADVDVRGLIETAAQTADLNPNELVTIVASIAPEACTKVRERTLVIWAEMALEDFRPSRSKRRQSHTAYTEIRAA